MISFRDDKTKMPFFDALKTTATIGLLMQQTAALQCPEAVPQKSSAYHYHARFDVATCPDNSGIEESLGFVQELTGLLKKGYSLLANAKKEERAFFINKLDPSKTDLIELQLRGLEGALKNAYKSSGQSDRDQLYPYLVTIAEARSAAASLNDLILQMIKVSDTFVSSINFPGLDALAKHGTEVFASGRFH
ncbi:hypothetical protein NB703_003075 [Pantoea ananatis]|uniref:Uncharacterized protein n=1 Tax=Pantoea ananas TaxID=553 RepID=A0AAJ1FQV9_PANAN|nr:hypothetical protein [Pantoea ananatis]MCW0344982.1 hypothetical protein [Pantoea ananatis]